LGCIVAVATDLQNPEMQTGAPAVESQSAVAVHGWSQTLAGAVEPHDGSVLDVSVHVAWVEATSKLRRLLIAPEGGPARENDFAFDRFRGGRNAALSRACFQPTHPNVGSTMTGVLPPACCRFLQYSVDRRE
jgi:hypothetical protein